jgi:hypothetical protein
MIGIAARLSGGDLRSIGHAESVAPDLVRDETLVAQALALMSGHDLLHITHRSSGHLKD